MWLSPIGSHSRPTWNDVHPQSHTAQPFTPGNIIGATAAELGLNAVPISKRPVVRERRITAATQKRGRSVRRRATKQSQDSARQPAQGGPFRQPQSCGVQVGRQGHSDTRRKYDRAARERREIPTLLGPEFPECLPLGAWISRLFGSWRCFPIIFWPRITPPSSSRPSSPVPSSRPARHIPQRAAARGATSSSASWRWRTPRPRQSSS